MYIEFSACLLKEYFNFLHYSDHFKSRINFIKNRIIPLAIIWKHYTQVLVGLNKLYDRITKILFSFFEFKFQIK